MFEDSLQVVCTFLGRKKLTFRMKLAVVGLMSTDPYHIEKVKEVLDEDRRKVDM